ncbi:MAG: nucleotidyltransferase domain-containing protein [Candidatus Altiarchaeota archaeon]|nr:nucleotidyltransferase domain-containing protein [Candidatus Altiarchaeota archaeon]
MNLSEKLQSREKQLKKSINNTEGVISAYIFGSIAEGRETKLSDIDFAFYLDESLTKEKKTEIKLKLINNLTQIMGTDNIDVIIMNNAPTTLRYNALKSGRLITSTHETKRVMFEAKTLSQYLDRKYYNEKHTRKAINRIIQRGLT